MDLNEAAEVLKQHNYIMLEDKYMDDMNRELDQSLLLNNIVDKDNIK